MHYCTHRKCYDNFGKKVVGPQISTHRWNNSIHIYIIHISINRAILIISSKQKDEAIKYQSLNDEYENHSILIL